MRSFLPVSGFDDSDEKDDKKKHDDNLNSYYFLRLGTYCIVVGIWIYKNVSFLW